MHIEIHKEGKTTIAEVVSDDIEIKDVQDALDLMANAGYMGAEKIILYEKNLATGFFDLKTGIAGEILQKFTNYRVQLAIIGDFSTRTSKSLRDFIYESNKIGRILFLPSVEDAKERLK